MEYVCLYFVHIYIYIFERERTQDKTLQITCCKLLYYHFYMEKRGTKETKSKTILMCILDAVLLLFVSSFMLLLSFSSLVNYVRNLECFSVSVFRIKYICTAHCEKFVNEKHSNKEEKEKKKRFMNVSRCHARQ